MYIFNSFYLLHSYNPSFLICLCFNMASFRDQKKLGPRPDRSPLGVYFKISDEHPHPFHMRSPPPLEFEWHSTVVLSQSLGYLWANPGLYTIFC